MQWPRHFVIDWIYGGLAWEGTPVVRRSLKSQPGKADRVALSDAVHPMRLSRSDAIYVAERSGDKQGSHNQACDK